MEMFDLTGGEAEQSTDDGATEPDIQRQFFMKLKEALLTVAFSSPIGMLAVGR